MAIPRRHPEGREPQLPIIPRVVVPRFSTNSTADTDQDTIKRVVDAVHLLWCRIARYGDSWDDPAFHGQRVEFWRDLPSGELESSDDETELWPQSSSSNTLDNYAQQLDIKEGMYGDARIAIANYDYASKQWTELLTHPCWKKIITYPPVSVFAVLIHEFFGTASVDAYQILMFERNHEKAIECLEKDRLQFVSTVTPTYALFFSSLIEQGVLLPRPAPEQIRDRDDTPSDLDIHNGISVLSGMATANPSVDAFRKAFRAKGFSGSNAKLGQIYITAKKNRK